MKQAAAKARDFITNDISKWVKSLTSVTNIAFLILGFVVFGYPAIAEYAARDLKRKVKNLESMNTVLTRDVERYKGLAEKNSDGFAAVNADRAELALKLDTCIAEKELPRPQQAALTKPEDEKTEETKKPDDFKQLEPKAPAKKKPPKVVMIKTQYGTIAAWVEEQTGYDILP